MDFIKFWRRRNTTFPFQQTQTFGSILPSKDFRKLLDYERSRTDRNGREFSVMAFFLEHIATDNTALLHFIEVLSSRVRETEEIGWLRENTWIGVILPDTPFSGADKLAHDVLSLNGKTSSPPGYKVYTYPSHWFKGLNDQKTPKEKTESKKHNTLPGNRNLRAENNGFERLLAPHMPLWKRSVDILGALAGLILLSPLFLFIAALIKTVSPGPVFFKQVRVGFLGRTFPCWKFRTMEIEADSTLHQVHVRQLCSSDQPLKKLDDHDSRIIPFGRMLRKTGMDELPQLINVLLGEMSLVGPRPDIPYAVKHYLPWQNKRVETYPGLTGLWQVNGKNRTTFNEMMRLDISYVKNQSFWLDSKIFIKTLPAIIQQTREKSFLRE